MFKKPLSVQLFNQKYFLTPCSFLEILISTSVLTEGQTRTVETEAVNVFSTEVCSRRGWRAAGRAGRWHRSQPEQLGPAEASAFNDRRGLCFSNFRGGAASHSLAVCLMTIKAKYAVTLLNTERKYITSVLVY